MDDCQAQVRFKWIVVSIIVQQDVPLNQTECGDETIDCPPNGPPGSTKSAIVRGCFNRQLNRSCLVNLEPQQFFLNGVNVSVSPDSL